jgi:hypothetical protein
MCDVDDWASTMLLSPEVVTVVPIIYLDIDVKSLGECSNLDIVSVGSVARHTFKVLLPGSFDLFGTWCCVVKWS